jgi:tRNA A37 threonylcarbamoyladenosine synthetase subunit TsaC/SUA5/YrdC
MAIEREHRRMRDEARRPLARSERLTLERAGDVEFAARALADGAAVAHGFGNFYGVTASAEREVVERINVMKGRPRDQVGSAVTTPLRIPRLFAWDALPHALTAAAVLGLMDHLLDLGPFGFRGPAALHVPDQLASFDGAVRTTQIISPGARCPSNAFLRRAMELTRTEFLYVTSANHSRHKTGAEDEPAHFRGDAIAYEFRDEPQLLVLHHGDDDRARADHPKHDPMSTTILAFHRLGTAPAGAPPTLFVERHGSLPLDALREEVARFGFGLALGPKAQRRLALRSYTDGSG